MTTPDTSADAEFERLVDTAIRARLELQSSNGSARFIAAWQEARSALIAYHTAKVAAAYEEAAKVAEDCPDRALHIYDRPGGPPGNQWVDIKGQWVIARAIRARATAAKG